MASLWLLLLFLFLFFFFFFFFFFLIVWFKRISNVSFPTRPVATRPVATCIAGTVDALGLVALDDLERRWWKEPWSWEVDEAPTYKQTHWTSRNKTLDENKIEEIVYCCFEEASCDSEEMPRPRIDGILNQMLTDWPTNRFKHARVNQQPFVQDFVRDDDWTALKVALEALPCFLRKATLYTSIPFVISQILALIAHDEAFQSLGYVLFL